MENRSLRLLYMVTRERLREYEGIITERLINLSGVCLNNQVRRGISPLSLKTF